MGLIPICIATGILIYFNTSYNPSFLHIICILLINSICFFVTKKYLEQLKIIWIIFFIFILITVGYGASLIRVNNIKIPQFNTQSLKGKIVAEVEEIETRGNEKNCY